MLEDLNYEVIRAPTPFMAIDILETRSDIDLVVTDQIMPAMTGTQLIEVIRQRWPAMPIILATGYAYTQRDLAEAVRAARCG